MLSGKLAAQAIIEAKASDDFSAMCLSRYRELLDESVVMADLHKIRNVTDFAHARPHLLREYPRLLSECRGVPARRRRPEEGEAEKNHRHGQCAAQAPPA